MANRISLYDQAQRQGQETLRQAILDAASELLATAGPQGLTMRSVARAVGCSTTVLYTMFGGKEGVVDALYREGFRRLAARLESAQEESADLDPLSQAAELARAYRTSALADPNYYFLMFGNSIEGFEPSPQSRQVAEDSIGLLEAAVTKAKAAGLLGDAGTREVAEVLWAAAHGVVSLELGGHLPSDAAAERYRTLCMAALTPYLTDAAAITEVTSDR